MITRWRDKLTLLLLSSFKVNVARTLVYKACHPRVEPKLVFVFGCQRSGTTITQRLIELDPQVTSYGEGDAPYFYAWPERSNRLLDDEVVRVVLDREKSRRVLLKPLYESQRAEELLNAFPGSRGVWVFRNYRDVIASHRSYYQHRDPRAYVAPIIEGNSESWMGARCSEPLRDLLKALGEDELSVDDLYGLFWIARCELYWPLCDDSRVFLLDYDQLRESPRVKTEQLYDFLGLRFRPSYPRLVRAGRPGQHDEQQLHPLIRDYCEEVLSQLRGFSR